MSRSVPIPPEKLSTLRESVKLIINLLADGEWQGLENMTDGKRLSADDLKAVVNEYGGTLVPIPDSEFQNWIWFKLRHRADVFLVYCPPVAPS